VSLVLIHLKRIILIILSSKVFTSGSILVVTSVITSFLNLVYHTLIGRFLGVEELGVFTTLISLGNSITAPVFCISLLLTKSISELFSSGQIDRIHPTFFLFSRRLMFISICVAAIGIVFSKHINNYFELGNVNALRLLFILLCIGSLSSLMIATIHGLHQFKESAIFRIFSAFFKTLACAIFLISFTNLDVVFLATILGELFLIIICLKKIWPFLIRRQNLKKPNVSRSDFFIQTFFATISLTVAIQSDVILVSLFFSQTETGIYAVASTLAKAAVFLSSNYVTVMFSLVAGGQHTTKENLRMIIQISFLSILCGGLASLGFLIIGDYLAYVILGKLVEGSGKLAAVVSISMVPLVLLHAFEHYFIAQGSIIVAWALVISAPIIYLSSYIFNSHILLIPIMIGVITTFIAIFCMILVVNKRRMCDYN